MVTIYEEISVLDEEGCFLDYDQLVLLEDDESEDHVDLLKEYLNRIGEFDREIKFEQNGVVSVILSNGRLIFSELE